MALPTGARIGTATEIAAPLLDDGGAGVHVLALDPDVADGVTPAQAAIMAAATKTPGLPGILAAADQRTTAVALYNGRVALRGFANTRIVKDHSGNGIRIEPTAAVVDVVQDAAAGALALTVSGAGWSTDEWVGHYVEVQTTWNTIPTLVRRRVVSNTADTLALDYGIGVPVSTGNPLTIYNRVVGVYLEDFEIVGSGGSAGLVIQLCEDVRLKNVRSRGHTGNGISINSCHRVRLDDCVGADSQFGIFVYNCDDAILRGCRGENSSGVHTIQLKDCRDSRAIGCTAMGGSANPAGVRGIDIKGSGLNPAFNCHVIDANVLGVTGAGVEAYSLCNEGEEFGLENATIGGRVRPGVNRPSVAFRIQAADGGFLRNVRGQGLQGNDCTMGLFVDRANDVEVDGFTFERMRGRSVFGTDASRVKLVNGAIRNGNWGAGSTDREIRLTNCFDWTVDDITVDHSDATSQSIGAVQELTSGDRNIFRDVTVRDTAGGYTAYFALLGPGSRVSHTARGRQSPAFTSPMVINVGLGEVVDLTLTGNITFNTPTSPNRGLRLTLILRQDGTGGHTVSFNAAWKANWTPSTSANAVNIITFEYDGTTWLQVATSTGL